MYRPRTRAKPIPPTRPPQGTRREASVGRAGGGRPLHPHPDQVIIAKAQVCPHCGQGVAGQRRNQLQAVYDKIEVPPIKPIVTRVEPYGGRCAALWAAVCGPVPTGMEPGTPFGASVQSLATYLRYTHAISDERLSGLFAQVFGLGISEGAPGQSVPGRSTGRLDDRVAEILTRLRRSRLICSDETSARVNGRSQWEWVFQTRRGLHPCDPPQPGPGRDPRSPGGRIGRRSGCPISTVPNRTTPLRTGRSAWPISCGIANLPSTPADTVFAPRMKASAAAGLCHPQTS